jgi:hypothetical protein
MASERTLSIRPGPAGWTEARWLAGSPDEVVCYVRFAIRDQTSRFHVAEFRMVEPWVTRHRELPLGRIENAVNADVAASRALSERYNEKPPADVAAWFGQTAARREQVEQRYRLARPTARRLADSFYADVAAAYRDAVAAGLNPRKAIALDADTPADTVARWIREARRRGFLPPGEPGKVTASASISATGQVTARGVRQEGDS